MISWIGGFSSVGNGSLNSLLADWYDEGLSSRNIVLDVEFEDGSVVFVLSDNKEL